MPQSIHTNGQQPSVPTATIASGEVVVGPKVQSSPLDTREYRALTLPNGLNALLVSCTDTDKAAASLDVSVGSFQDPDGIPGLAHFLEHMLFLGTEKFPDEESYNTFLAENGGQSNAYTAPENTNYHFSMVISDRDNTTEEPRFKEALNRFSQFFIGPLFTESATDRELNAVHSEHQKNLQNDSRRIFQLRHSTANADHPFSKFATGSKETLHDIPKKQNIDIRKKLIEFYHKYYSANLMNLCIQAPYSLDTLQSWVTQLFSQVPNSDIPHPANDFKDVSPLLKQHNGLMYYVESVRDIHLLELSWLTDSYVYDNDTKPSRLLSSLLGDEGEGSLLSHLKNLGWCDACSAGPFETHNFNFFLMCITLTNDGINHIPDIVSKVYQYIRMLRNEGGVPKWLFDEEANLADIAFQFREREEPMHLVTRVTSRMAYLKPNEYLTGHILINKYDNAKIKQLLAMFVPENCNVTIAGQGDYIQKKVNTNEKWYNTKYGVERITDERMNKWKTDPIDEALHLPPKNAFIPTDFKLVEEKKDNDEDKQHTKGPELIEKNDYFELFHKLDTSFKRPRASIILKFITPLVYQSPWHAVMADLLTYILEDLLSEYSYPAQRAGFKYDFDKVDGGFLLLLSGYNHHIDTVLQTIVQRLCDFQVDQMRFDMQKDIIQRHYMNFSMAHPYQHALYHVSYMLEDPRWHINEYIALLKNGNEDEDGINVTNLNRFAKDVLKKMWVTALVVGNIDKTQAINIVSNVQKIIGYKPLASSQITRRRIVQLPVGKDIYSRYAHPNTDDNNSSTMMFHQFGPQGNPRNDVTTELLDDILSKPCFNELRTVQQLGYMVFEGLNANDGIRGLFIIVQSTVVDPDEILQRIEGFLLKVRAELLTELSDEKFNDYVRALTAKKAEPDRSIIKMASRFWTEIDSGLFRFNRNQDEVAVLKQIKKEEVIQLFDDKVAKNGQETKRIIAQVYGNEHPFDKRKPVIGEVTDESEALEFRRQHPLYAVVGSKGKSNLKKVS